ncbi:MAG: phage holin family protein [Microthrixaceae bacterium]|nr:phage holin family protein [Microthrixaceae bacterium]
MSPRSSGANRTKPADQVGELRDLVVGYAKQETLEPLQRLKRFLAFGVSGALCVGIGMGFLMLGLLRGLQRLDVFNGPTQRNGWHGSWLIYVITLVVGMIVLAAALAAARRPVGRRRSDGATR